MEDRDGFVVVVFHVRGIFFFFFQAEDGIRDLTVTGVQTCALPISRGGRTAPACRATAGRRAGARRLRGRGANRLAPAPTGADQGARWPTRAEIGRASCRERG